MVEEGRCSEFPSSSAITTANGYAGCSPALFRHFFQGFEVCMSLPCHLKHNLMSVLGSLKIIEGRDIELLVESELSFAEKKNIPLISVAEIYKFTMLVINGA